MVSERYTTCHMLNCVLLKFTCWCLNHHYLRMQTIFGLGFQGWISLNEVIRAGPNPLWLVSLYEEIGSSLQFLKYLGGWGGWITRSRDLDHPGQNGETLSLLKIQKISWAWWRVPVIPATQEAEAGELPEPRRQRLRWAKIAPLHSILGNRVGLKKTMQKKLQVIIC